MGPLVVVEVQVPSDASASVAHAIVRVEVDLLVLSRGSSLCSATSSLSRSDPTRSILRSRTKGMQYEGVRFQAVCRLAGKLYGNPFGIDVAFGDPIAGHPSANNSARSASRRSRKSLVTRTVSVSS